VYDWYKSKRTAPDFAQDQAMIILYKGVMDKDLRNIEFTDETGRKLDLDQEVLCLAADSDSLPVLLSKIKSVVDAKSYDAVEKSLQYFAPIYDQMVWQPRLAALETQLAEHNQQAISSKMVEMLREVQSFMKAPWVSGTPFKIVLVPLPINGQHKHGESIGRVQIVELRPEDTFAKSADVVFHEACHALWFSKKDKAEADKQFITAGGETVPLTEIYESMATAFAQGCFSQQAFGKTSRVWYRDKYIDEYSHKVVKLYAEYLNAGRPIDKDFCRRAADIFFQLYPDANRNIQLISEFLILADQIGDIEVLKKEIYRAVPRNRGCSICVPINASESLKTYKEFERPHVAVLIKKEALAEIVVLGVTASQIEALKSTVVPTTINVDHKMILFCIADTAAAQQKLLLQCLKKTKWPRPL
jgi:hypothetical protein